VAALLALASPIAAESSAFGEDDGWAWQDIGDEAGGSSGGAAKQMPTGAVPLQKAEQAAAAAGQQQPLQQQQQHDTVSSEQREQQKQKQQKKEEPPKNFFEAVKNYVENNPIMTLVMCYWIYNKFQGSQPWPDFGGNITEVNNVDEWDALVGECAKEGRALIVDGFALWCGPCKSCAPNYARPSEALSDKSVTFCKFNVDNAPDLAKKLNVSSMPQFIVFKEGKEVERIRGFPGDQRLKQVLMSYGAKEAPAIEEIEDEGEEDEDEDDDDDDDNRIEDITDDKDKDQ